MNIQGFLDDLWTRSPLMVIGQVLGLFLLIYCLHYWLRLLDKMKAAGRYDPEREMYKTRSYLVAAAASTIMPIMIATYQPRLFFGMILLYLLLLVQMSCITFIASRIYKH